MATAEVTPVPQPTKPTILDKSLYLSVRRSWPSLSKSINSSVVQGKADPRMIHVQKNLYDSPELKKIFSHNTRIDSFLKTKAIAFPGLKSGDYLVPDDMFGEVEAALTKHVDELAILVEQAGAVFERMVEDAKQRLDVHFKQADYPTKEEFMDAFGFDWQYLQFGLKEAVQKLNKEAVEREQERREKVIREAEVEVRLVIRAQLQGLVNHMVEVLQPAEEGKRKVFRKDMMNNLLGFIDSFKSRNLTEDSELEQLVTKAKLLVQGIDPTSLKSDDALRQNVQSGFTEIKQSLDKLVVEAPTRSMRFKE